MTENERPISPSPLEIIELHQKELRSLQANGRTQKMRLEALEAENRKLQQALCSTTESQRTTERQYESLREKHQALEAGIAPNIKEFIDMKCELEAKTREIAEQQSIYEEKLRIAESTSTMCQSDSHDKISQLTRQKAEIRCDLLESQRQFQQSEEKRLEAEKRCDDAIKNFEKISERNESAEAELRDLREKLGAARKEIGKMSEHLVMADKQYAHLKNQKDTVELRLQKLEAALQASRRELEAVRAENERHTSEVEFLTKENIRLLRAKDEASVQSEEHKKNWQAGQDTCDGLKRELEELTKRLTKKREDFRQLKQADREKSKRIYNQDEELFQSYQRNRELTSQLESVARKRARRSTSVSVLSDMDSSLYRRESEDVGRLEEEKQQLQRLLAEKKRLLAEQKASSTVSTPSRQPSTSSAANTPTRQLILRHDIPHKWKTHPHLGVIKCSLCSVRIKPFENAQKCVHCEFVVHSSCAPRVNNTCGMPEKYKEYCQGGTQSTVSSGFSDALLDDDFLL